MKLSEAQLNALRRLDAAAKKHSEGIACLQEQDVRTLTTVVLYASKAIEHVRTVEGYHWQRRGHGRTAYNQKAKLFATYVKLTPEGKAAIS